LASTLASGVTEKVHGEDYDDDFEAAGSKPLYSQAVKPTTFYQHTSLSKGKMPEQINYSDDEEEKKEEEDQEAQDVKKKKKKKKNNKKKKKAAQ